MFPEKVSYIYSSGYTTTVNHRPWERTRCDIVFMTCTTPGKIFVYVPRVWFGKTVSCGVPEDVHGTPIRLESAAVLRLRVSGFVTKFGLGRQAAWRPRGNRGGVVKTLMALCILMLCCGCVSRTLYIIILRIWESIVYAWENFLVAKQGSSSVVKLLGGRGAIVMVSTRTVVGTVQSAAVCGCVSHGLSVHIRARSSRLINGRVQS